jgi:glutaredoxin
MATSFKALLFVQDRCDPCTRTKQALRDAFDQSEHIEVIPFKDDEGLKTDTAKDYSIEVTPTLILVRPDGSEINRFKGSKNLPAVFLSKVARFLNGANKL